MDQNDKPKIYISKRCGHCIELLKILRDNNDIKGNYIIVSIDDEPFPNYIKTVPYMVHKSEQWNAKEIFSMLKDINEGEGDQQTSNMDESKECEVDSFCSSDNSCLSFSLLEETGDSNTETIDSFYKTMNTGSSGNYIDNHQQKKKDGMDNDYERLIKERGEINPGPQSQ